MGPFKNRRTKLEFRTEILIDVLGIKVGQGNILYCIGVVETTPVIYSTMLIYTTTLSSQMSVILDFSTVKHVQVPFLFVSCLLQSLFHCLLFLLVPRIIIAQ